MNHGSGDKPEKSQGSDKPFNCSQCHKISNTLDEMKKHEKEHTCPDYLESKCLYGGKGENENGICSFAHPRKCRYFQTNSCRKGTACRFLHIKSSRQGNSSPNAHQKQRPSSHSSAQHVTRGSLPPRDNRVRDRPDQSNDLAFLCKSIENFKREVSDRLKKLEQDQNNNKGRWPQVWQ